MIYTDGLIEYIRGENLFTNITDANECIPLQANYEASYIMSITANNCPVKPSIITTYKQNTDRYTQVCVPSGIKGQSYWRYGTLNNGVMTWSKWFSFALSDNTLFHIDLGNNTKDSVLSNLLDKAISLGVELFGGSYYDITDNSFVTFYIMLRKINATLIGSGQFINCQSSKVTYFRNYDSAGQLNPTYW